MKAKGKKLKRHIISLRVSAEEWENLREVMQGLEFRRVSDLMREAFKLALTPPPFSASQSEGHTRSS